MNDLISRLILLFSSILSGKTYNTSISNFDIDAINKIALENNIKNYQTENLFDVYCNQRYILVFDEKASFVYDIFEHKDIFWINATNPFLDSYKESIHIFTAPSSNTPFLCLNNDYVWQPRYPECCIPINMFNGNVEDFPIFPELQESDLNNSTKISNYKYFMKLKKRHGYNSSNLCTLVAIQLLMSYYDNFYSDAYIEEHFDYPASDSVINVSSFENWPFSSSSGYEGESNGDFRDNRFLDFLYTYAVNNVNILIDSFGLSHFQQKSVLDWYIFERNFQYSLNTSQGNYLDILDDNNVYVIKNAINNNRPVIACGSHHSVVAFAYDNEKLYVHNGWGFCEGVPWSYFTSFDLIYSPSAIDYVPYSSNHFHNNNYYSSYTKKYYCSCGEEQPSNILNFDLLSMSPAVYPQSFVYSGDFVTSITYRNVFTYVYDQRRIKIKSGGEIVFLFSYQVNSITIETDENISDLINNRLEIKTLSGDNWIESFDVNGIFSFQPYSIRSASVNGDKLNTRAFRIRNTSNNSADSISIKSIVFSIC